jgi:hypothetical protein
MAEYSVVRVADVADMAADVGMEPIVRPTSVISDAIAS